MLTLLSTYFTGKICREDGQVDPECFVTCQKFALNKIQEQ